MWDCPKAEVNLCVAAARILVHTAEDRQRLRTGAARFRPGPFAFQGRSEMQAMRPGVLCGLADEIPFEADVNFQASS